MDLNIDFSFNKKCEHCNGSGKCDYYHGVQDEVIKSMGACPSKCSKPQPITRYKNGAKRKNPIYDTYNVKCDPCKGRGWVLSELGLQFKLFMDHYYWPDKEDKIRAIADQAVYDNQKIDY